MVKFFLVGPNQGKTGSWGGYRFLRGVCNVAVMDVENAKRLLCRYYGAYPEYMLNQDAEGNVSLKPGFDVDGAPVKPETVHPVSIEAVPEPEQQPEQQPEPQPEQTRGRKLTRA